MAAADRTNGQNTEKKVYKRFKYKKRSGTTSMSGFYYKSHLISLILSRNLNEETKFVLGCNVDEIGVMNEICLKFRHKDDKENSVAVFIKTKNTGHVTDDDLTNPKSTFNLYKCYQSHVLIKERFDDNTDALFEGNSRDMSHYFVIITPHQIKTKNHINVPKDDQIHTDYVNSILGASKNSKIVKVLGESLVTDLINAKIEIIAKTIAAYVTCEKKDEIEITKEIKDVFEKYHRLLIPHVIKIDKNDETCSGEFNESLHKNNNSHIKLLREIMVTEILKKTHVIEAEANSNITLLLESKDHTADLVSKLIGTVITFDQNTNKFEYVHGILDDIHKRSLDGVETNKTIVDEALVIAGMNTLKVIKIDFNDFNVKEIIENQEDTNENLVCVFEDEKQAAEKFLKHFYIYSEQEDVSKRLNEEIVKNQVTNKKSIIFQSKPKAALTKFYDKVQKWILSMDMPQYLTDSCDFLKDIANIDDPYLSILNYNCVMELQTHNLEFKCDSFSSFTKLDETQSRTNIISNNVFLTSIKLMQYLSNKRCIFVNYDQVYEMKDTEFDMLMQEISKTTFKIFVIIVREAKDVTKCNKFKDIVDNFHGKLVTVSKYPTETIYDNIKGFEDIANGNELLKYNITVHGEKRELGMIIDEHSMDLIDAEILYKIINNESIEIGKILTNSSYNEIGDCLMDRQLCSYAASCDTFINHLSGHDGSGNYNTDNYDHFDLYVKPFDFLNKDDVVLIFADSGMGKSTLLTDLAVKMNRAFPNKMIVKMNLLQYSKYFFEWDKKDTDVDILESMHLVCRAELNHELYNKLFKLEKQSNGDLFLKVSAGLDSIALLHLKLLIRSFNSGNIVFLFDGFDEICPHYENVGVKFLKSFVKNTDIVDDNVVCPDNIKIPQGNKNKLCINDKTTDISKQIKNKNKILITSRSYNTTKRTLETVFNIKPLYLTRLRKEEQTVFYQTYWKTRIKLKELNADQFKNIEAFFQYMDQYRISNYNLDNITRPTNMLLCRVQEAAVEYFRSEIDASTDNTIDKKALLSKWINQYQMFDAEDSSRFTEGYLDELQLTGSPLHMKIYAELFANEIKDTSLTKIWDLGIHRFEFYNRFLEVKLKNIRLQEKGGEDVNTSDSSAEYDNLVKDVTDEHKKLAFYAFFHDKPSYFNKILSEPQLIKIQLIIERIKNAEEKTGLIDRIDEGVPRFVHLVFAEYYAVEFIADMLKMSFLTDDEVHQQIDFVVNCLLKSSVGIMRAFDHKLNNDDKLRKVLDEEYTKKCIFTVWMEQDVTQKQEEEKEPMLSKDSYIQKILQNDLIETAKVLISSLENNLNAANVEKFVNIIGSDFFEFALDDVDLIVYVLDALRRIDPSMVVKALLNCGLELGGFPDNELILKHMFNKTKNNRYVVVKSTDQLTGDSFYGIGGIYRWS